MKLASVLLCVGLAALSSCKIGDKNLIFATNASFGVDLDSAPTTVSFGYSRDELSVGPLTEEGEVLPVMSSFSAGSNFIDTMFAAGISQSFAIGNAAYILSKYFLSPDNPSDPDRENAKSEDAAYFEDASASGVHGGRQKDTCYVFGTTTTIGFRLGISNANVISIGVDSLSFGYKRKELAFAPITEEDVPPSTEHPSGVKQVVPPLLATIVSNSTAGSAGTGTGTAQLYATGHAATYLAAEPGVRGAIGHSFVKEEKIQKALQQVAIANIQKTAAAVREEADKLNDIAETVSEARALIDQAKEDGKLAEARSVANDHSLGNFDDWEEMNDDARVKALRRAVRVGDDEPEKADAVAKFNADLKDKLAD